MRIYAVKQKTTVLSFLRHYKSRTLLINTKTQNKCSPSIRAEGLAPCAGKYNSHQPPIRMWWKPLSLPGSSGSFVRFSFFSTLYYYCVSPPWVLLGQLRSGIGPCFFIPPENRKQKPLTEVSACTQPLLQICGDAGSLHLSNAHGLRRKLDDQEPPSLLAPPPWLLPRRPLASPVVRVAPPLLSQPPPLCCLSALPRSGILRHGAQLSLGFAISLQANVSLPHPSKLFMYRMGFLFVCFVFPFSTKRAFS